MGHAQSPAVALVLVNTAHDQEFADALGARAGQNRLPVSIELWHVDVAVAVNKAWNRINHEFSSYLYLFSYCYGVHEAPEGSKQCRRATGIPWPLCLPLQGKQTACTLFNPHPLLVLSVPSL